MPYLLHEKGAAMVVLFATRIISLQDSKTCLVMAALPMKQPTR